MKAWNRLLRRPIAFGAAIALVILYLGMAFCEFLAPYSAGHLFENHSDMPPNLSWYSKELGFGPQVQTLALLDPVKRDYVRVKGEYTRVRWFVAGDEAKLWGIIPTVHLFGTDYGRDPEGKAQPVFLLGTDNLGRDVLSRLLYGSRISLTIGFVGVFVSLFLALVFGGLAGYFGGAWDWIVMRLCEFIILVPSLYLILFLRSILSEHMDTGQSYMLITVILSFVGWPGTARMIRGMVHAIKRQDFVANAQLESMPSLSILFRHVVPQMSSILILSVTLGVPGFILGETALSYLGLGIVDPAVSWGSMINRDGTSVYNLITFPWLFAPGVLLVVVSLSFNFLGEWLRDLADPNWKESA
jgi:peptide/nickel transport system permease protein